MIFLLKWREYYAIQPESIIRSFVKANQRFLVGNPTLAIPHFFNAKFGLNDKTK